MNRHGRSQNTSKLIGIIVGIIALIYIGLSFYFMNHFFIGSVINGVNYSGKTVEQVEKHISDNIDEYQLVLLLREDKEEVINAKDIDLKYISDGTIQELKETQNPFNWFFGMFQSFDEEMAVTVDYDESKLKEYYLDMDCFKKSSIVEPEDAHPKFNGSEFAIVKEVYGTHIKKKPLYELVKNAIEMGETSIDLEVMDQYYNPSVKEDDDKLKAAIETLNKYISAKITYDLDDRTEVADASVIHQWLVWDDDFKVSISEEEVIAYIKTLEAKYNTLGTTREFTTTAGKKIKVPSGNYGWMISRGNEKEALIQNVMNSEQVTREPVYAQQGYTRKVDDIGNTYVEIDLKKQHMWFYKNGELLVETDVVTGNTSRGYNTPGGVYGITYKERDATLNGENYSSPVNYWMPFNGNIGIHDASWRTTFGGQIYRTNGSHGCVNTPYKNAKKIYENIDKNVPVICY